MAGAHLASGSIVMQKDAPVTVQVGPLQARFAEDDVVALPHIDFAVQVPFDKGVAVISTTNWAIEIELGNFRLISVFTGAGAHGEIVTVNYSLYQE